MKLLLSFYFSVQCAVLDDVSWLLAPAPNHCIKLSSPHKNYFTVNISSHCLTYAFRWLQSITESRVVWRNRDQFIRFRFGELAARLSSMRGKCECIIYRLTVSMMLVADCPSRLLTPNCSSRAMCRWIWRNWRNATAIYSTATCPYHAIGLNYALSVRRSLQRANI